MVPQINAEVIVADIVILDLGLGHVMRPLKNPEARGRRPAVYENGRREVVGAGVLESGHCVLPDVGHRAVPDLDAILGNTAIRAVTLYRIVYDCHVRPGILRDDPVLGVYRQSDGITLNIAGALLCFGVLRPGSRIGTRALRVPIDNSASVIKFI